ncbi:MAG: D-alanine--D-alanine ligase [Bdellovibrionales bacterium]|nr:D-alanine--D-alanine ligase [Bdellovibrionales bacterium]NQZ18761.1 D-alanine--D-alanine ligase [Bdellovibrionales bacterium]
MKTVALIFGGPSPEHDVSLFSGKNIFQALTEAGVQTHCLGVTHSRQWKLIKGEELLETTFEKPIKLDDIGLKVELVNEDGKVFVVSSEAEEKLGPIDVAFPIIHGPYGEDGELAKILEDLPIPYVGSDHESCIICLDKELTKEAIKFTSIHQTPYLVCKDENPEYQDVVDKLGSPFFVKPARMGSSIGIHKVHNEDEYHKAVADARIHDSKLVMEKLVKAREVECAVLVKGDDIDVAGPAEIIPSHDFYSYEAKYIDPNGAEYKIPAAIDDDVAQKIRITAKEAFKHLKCKDYGRVDFFLTKDNQIIFNELNTHPGFTNISLFPQLWNNEGLVYKDLILHLLNKALQESSNESE